MATKDIANKESELKAVCSAPDMCRVGKDVIPFDSFRDLSHEKVYSPNVKARGVPVLTVNSVVSGTTSNAGQGITSQVSQGSGDVRITSGSGTVITNGLAQGYHLSDVQMNCQGAVCNTSGKLYTGTATPLKTASENKQPCNQPPKTDAELDDLKARRAALQKTFGADGFDQSQRLQGWADGAQGYLDKTYANNQAIRDQWVASQSPGLARGAATAVAGIDGVVDQGATALAGLAKDVGIGLGQLLNFGATQTYQHNASAQMAQRAIDGLSMQDLDALILAKDIQLGNVCAGSVWKGVKDAGKAIAAPVVHEWEQGRPIGAVTRGASEIVMTVGTLGAGAAVKGGATAGGTLGRIGESAAAAGRVEQAAGPVAKAGQATDIVQGARAGEAATQGSRAEAGIATRETSVAKVNEVAPARGNDGVRVRKRKLEPGSAEHKADRWRRYQGRGGKMDYEDWSKQYDTNMRNYKFGLAREGDYRTAMGASEGTLKTPLTNRQIDILKADEMYAGQLKTGPVSLTVENSLAIQKDAELVKRGWEVEHILEQGASAPYLNALDKAGISYRLGPQIPLPN